jgi:PD-(D/E)XK nuclease superfamily
MSEHYYDKDGNPHHWVEKKSGPGNRATTIKDARKNGWLPSVTGIVNVLAKPQLERWKMMQACSAVLTSPRREGEGLDAFMERVLFQDKEGEQEARIAAERGSGIHDAIASGLKEQPFDPAYFEYVNAAVGVLESLGKIVTVEKVVVGNGYAGRMDALVENAESLVVLDWKSASKLPEKDSWDDHKLQTAAYAATFGNTNGKRILTANLYLSTKQPGKTAFFVQDNWRETYERGFVPLLRYWQFANDYITEIKP